MNTKFDITLNEALKAIEDYTYLRRCFSDYLKWLFDECDENRRVYDVLYFKISTDRNSLGELENIFREFGTILEIDESEFYKMFQLNLDWNKHDIMKLADLLAEPWVALALQKAGFSTIRKRFRQISGAQKSFRILQHTGILLSSQLKLRTQETPMMKTFTKRELMLIIAMRLSS